MSIDNVKLLNEINVNFLNIIEKYSNNKRVLNKVNNYVKEKLQLHIDKISKEENDIDSTKKERDYFVNYFLSSMENIYYYVKEQDLFIHYDMKHYKCVEEDMISNLIYNDIIDNHPRLSQYKFDIQNDIVDEYKKQPLVQSIPESYTIQNVIKFLMTYFFDNKDDAKYFCCILGDIILNKEIDIVCCLNEHLLNFINNFQTIIENCIDTDIFESKINHFTVDKITSTHDISKHRILYSNTNKLCLWNDFLNRHAIDIYVVCVHYSKRYLNSEKYLTHHKTPDHILYLKKNTVKTIVETFGLQKITVEPNSCITHDNMKFLWYKYLKLKQIPINIIPISRLHKDMLNYAKYDVANNNYLCVNHHDNSLIVNVKDFIQNCIIQENNDQLEISEFIEIYTTSKYSGQNVDEQSVIEIIKYFTNYTIENDDKTINNVKCILWDKKGDLNKFINLMKTSHQDSSRPINENLSFNTIYTKYCKYTSNNGNVNKIVTKKYFINYILSTIPNKFIYFNKVLQTFWSNE